MAQILKDESRNAIIESAKEEFLDKGFNNASMRNIAKKAKMTVGNLYRYFKSKDEISEYIVSDTYNSIDLLIKNLTSNNVSIISNDINLKYSTDELRQILNELADNLVDIYKDHKIEFNILMYNSKINERITNWFTDAINVLINNYFDIEGYEKEKYILSKSYAESIFMGMRVIFKENDLDISRLKTIVRAYLNSYIYMFDADIRKLV